MRDSKGGTKIARPAKHLSREAKKIWRDVLEEFELEACFLPVLKTALEHYDMMNLAREEMAGQITVKNPKTKFVRVHPALQVMKESRSGYLQAWRMLGLGEEPPGGGPGRPPKSKGSQPQS